MRARSDSPVSIPFSLPTTTVTRGRPRTPAATEPITYPGALTLEALREVRAVLDATDSLADWRKLPMPTPIAPAALNGLLHRAAADFGIETVFWLAAVKRFRPGNAIYWHCDEITFPMWRIRPHVRAKSPNTADVSFNVTLAGPDEYEGAAFETRDGRTLRLNAGDAIAFPSDCEHRVTRMTSGRRYTAVFVGVDFRRLPAGGYRNASTKEKI